MFRTARYVLLAAALALTAMASAVPASAQETIITEVRTADPVQRTGGGLGDWFRPRAIGVAHEPLSSRLGAAAPRPAAPEPDRAEAVRTALAQTGDPYRWGAEGPDAFDCSGLVRFAYASVGVDVPHSSRALFAMSEPVEREDLQVGDLIFYGSPIYHVAIYAGDGRTVEAPNSRAAVRVVTDALERPDLVGIGRLPS